MITTPIPTSKRRFIAGPARDLALPAAILSCLLGGAPAAALTAEPIGTFERPVQVAVAPGEPALLFVVETAGRIQVLREEETLAKPFLDIASRVLGPPDSGAGGEQGLLSVAFAPDYAASRLFYVAYTNRDGDVEIDEFKRSAANARRADPESRRTVLVVRHRAAQNHNGGQLQFGPDGLLYISIGDGGDSPSGEHARDLDSLLGKILRIDPRKDGEAAYRVPGDNPFVGRKGRDEIFAYGLRNPWRFSFDGQRIAIADVGQSQWEEVDFLPLRKAAGANFGWPEFEGKESFDPSRPGKHEPTFPIATYDHAGGRCAITGGYVVHDPDLPELDKGLLYGDFCSGQLFLLRADVKAQTGTAELLDLDLPQLSGFGRGHDGQVYLVQLGGTVSRLEP